MLIFFSLNWVCSLALVVWWELLQFSLLTALVVMCVYLFIVALLLKYIFFVYDRWLVNFLPLICSKACHLMWFLICYFLWSCFALVCVELLIAINLVVCASVAALLCALFQFHRLFFCSLVFFANKTRMGNKMPHWRNESTKNYKTLYFLQELPTSPKVDELLHLSQLCHKNKHKVHEVLALS